MTNTISWPEAIFTSLTVLALLFVAIPNLQASIGDLRWVRAQADTLNGDYESKVRLTRHALRQDIGMTTRLLVLALIGVVFMTQDSPPGAVTWRAWFLYGALCFLSFSVAAACIRERWVRRAVLEDAIIRRERARMAAQEPPS